jgi:RNA polymerase sigma-70 factor (ECF subfamily)
MDGSFSHEGHEGSANRSETTRLLRQARAGAPDALDALFERCGRRLLALIRARMGRDLRSFTESRDLLHATLLKAFERFDQFERSDARSLMAWLAAIACNEIRDTHDYLGRQRRDRAVLTRSHGDLDAFAGQVEGQVSRVLFDERWRRLETALDRLEPDHREVILLRKLEEHGFAEIGRRMDRSPDACRMLLARAMAALTLAMEEP